MPTQESHPSIDLSPPGSRRGPIPLTLEHLHDRLSTVEQVITDRDSGDSSTAAELEKLRRLVAEQGADIKKISDQVTANAAEQKKLADAIGESPDLATDKPGSGMRKQLADLVARNRAPTWSSHIAAAGTVVIALYELLKHFGVLK